MYNVYCNTNTYECAYMYTVEWDAASPYMYCVMIYPLHRMHDVYVLRGY